MLIIELYYFVWISLVPLYNIYAYVYYILLLFLYNRWRNWDLTKLNHLSKITKPLRGRTGIWMCLNPTLVSCANRAEDSWCPLLLAKTGLLGGLTEKQDAKYIALKKVSSLHFRFHSCRLTWYFILFFNMCILFS